MDYQVSEDARKLELALHEYLQWFLQLTDFVFYPGTAESAPVLPPLTLKDDIASDEVAPEIFERVKGIYKDLKIESENLIQTVSQFQKVPSQQDYKKFAAFFDEFIKALRRIEQDCLMDGFGIDALTGLRSEKLLVLDIDEEINRLKRNGRDFCMALLRIDNLENFDETTMEPGGPEQKLILKISNLIKRSVRSFDDAYGLSDGKFVLVLKQTEMFGGFIVLERLKDLLKIEKAKDDQGRDITLSCCVTQPIKFDEASVLVEDLKTFLGNHSNEEGTILKFYEVTPVEKFLKEEHNNSA